jgi:N-acetylmuramoyl-L-alanine amidase
MQRALMTWNGFALPKWGMDGDFGSETRDWVKKFQREKKITVDGIVGPQTWGKLDAI